MTHHINYAFTVLGALMVICAVGSWLDARRRKWKPSRTVDSVGHTMLGSVILLDGLNLRCVPGDVLTWLMIISVCLLAIGFILFKIEAKAASEASIPKQPAA